MKDSRAKARTGLGKRIAGIALSAVLACSLAPGVALADLEAGSAAAPIEKQATKAAKKKMTTVYVLTKSKEVVKGSSYSATTTTSFSVNSKTGLLKKTVQDIKGDYYSSDPITTTWTYDKNNNLKSKKGGSDGITTTTKYAVTKKGVLKKDKRTADVSGTYGLFKSAYASKSGKIVKVKRKYYDEGRGTVTYAFKYKGGKIVKITDSQIGNIAAYKYDKHGNIIKAAYYKGGDKIPVNYKNKYDKNGNLVKTKSKPETGNGSQSTTTYKFKAVKVPKALAKKVKAQQWALQNGDLNFALGNW